MVANITRRNFFNAALVIPLFGMAGATGAATRLVSEAVSVLDFRLPRDVDDTEAFQRAIFTHKPVYIPAGRGLGASGAYLVRDLTLIAGADLFGDGAGQTVLRPNDTDAAFYCDSGSSNSRIVSIRISDLTIEGWVLKHGFAEHRHLLHLNGVQDVLIENVEFKGFQGDGVYLGSGRQAGLVRHNRNVTIRRCIFDGINNNNRNGISVIDGEQIHIEDCTFQNCTRANMPGAIDFEPDETKSAIIRDITIQRCGFFNVGGNLGVISFQIPRQVFSLPSQILISNNLFQNYQGTGSELHFNVNRTITAQHPSMDVVIKGNRGSGGQWIYAFYAANGVRVTGNYWENYKQGAMIGFTSANQLARNIEISDEFVECGQISGVGIYILNVSRLTLSDCRIVDCGNGSATSYGICFANGKSEFVTMTGLQISSPRKRTRVAIIREQLHKLSPTTNVQLRNNFGGLPGIDISKPV